MNPTGDKPQTSPLGPWLELKSERVQNALPRLTSWEPSLGGLDGSFRFANGEQALRFLRPLADLLDAHPEPPSRLTLTGPILSLALGLGHREGGVRRGDLALAQRISALRQAVGGRPPVSGRKLADQEPG